MKHAILGFFGVWLTCSLMTGSVHAEMFRLKLLDGSEIIGDLVEFNDEGYRLITTTGEQSVSLNLVQSAQPVKDGVAEFTILKGDTSIVVGRLVSFEDGVYDIETKAGRVKIPIEQVTRVEVALLQAPDTADKPADSSKSLPAGELRLQGAMSMAEGLAPVLLESFVQDHAGSDMRWSVGSQKNLRRLTAKARGDSKFSAEMRMTSSGEAATVLAMHGKANATSADAVIEIGMMSRPMSPEERQRVLVPPATGALATSTTPAGALEEHIVAPSGTVVIVHPNNTVKALTLDQISGIFSGKIRNWSDVGGPQRRIIVYVPTSESGVLQILKDRALGTARLLGSARAIGSYVEMAEIIASDPAAIGLVDFSHVSNAAPVSIIDDCGVARKPTKFTIRTEEYPLATRMYFYARTEKDPVAREFIRYALSEEGQRRLEERGFVSLLPAAATDADSIVVPPAAAGPITAAEQKARSELSTLAAAAKRLSLVFRFDRGGAELDALGVKDVDRLAQFLAGGGDEKRRIALVGFADGAGAFDANLRLSDKRAKFIAQKLKEKGVNADLVVGYGSLLPVSCGTSDAVFARNRRVEVWLF